jgi:hypothetical protein
MDLFCFEQQNIEKIEEAKWKLYSHRPNTVLVAHCSTHALAI